MVNAVLQDLTMERETPIQCALHYVKTDEGYRYRVRPKGKRLHVPREKSLKEVAAAEWWPVADVEEPPSASGMEEQKLQFPIHVGPWPAVCYREAHRTAVEDQLALYRTNTLRGEGPAWVNQQSLKTARRIERDVDPHSVLSAPEGLGSILQSGQFAVTGNVYFAPLQPFQLNPDIPESPEEVGDRLLAREIIPEYTYG